MALDLITLSAAKNYTKRLLGSGAVTASEDITNKVYDKYVIICVAGQSNAVGYDESPVDSNFLYSNKNKNRIKQLGFYGKDNLKLVDLEYCAQSMQDMRVHNRPNTTTPGTKGVHLPLANLMLDYIPDDYGVLVLPISFGGTGFTSGNAGTYSEELKKPTDTDEKSGEGTVVLKWGVDTAYYKTLKDRIIYALNLNKGNLFAGIIWCQGENDKLNAAEHYTAFQAMATALFTALNDAGLQHRVPKGVWDKDIWYNMETTSYWYGVGQCQQIWNNYKTWNHNTYIEIPRTAESNVVNGTGQTTENKPSHFGNNSYQKIIAPRILQKMIDMNTFFKKISVIEPMPESTNNEAEVSYPVATEATRILVQNDIETKSSVTFTIDETGKCTANKELQGTFVVETDEQPCVCFGDIFKIEWEVKRNMYWLLIEGDINENFLLLGLGGGNTRQLAKIENKNLTVIEQANKYPDHQYSFVVGDRIRIYRNSDKTLSIYRTNNANGILQKWFDMPNKNIYKSKILGFACGISGAEFQGNFTTEKMVVFDKMKIQKQELFPNNKFLDFMFDGLSKNS